LWNIARCDYSHICYHCHPCWMLPAHLFVCHFLHYMDIECSNILWDSEVRPALPVFIKQRPDINFWSPPTPHTKENIYSRWSRLVSWVLQCLVVMFATRKWNYTQYVHMKYSCENITCFSNLCLVELEKSNLNIKR